MPFPVFFATQPSYSLMAQRLEQLERKVSTRDQAITGVLRTIRELMQPPESKKRPIGFVWPEEKG